MNASSNIAQAESTALEPTNKALWSVPVPGMFLFSLVRHAFARFFSVQKTMLSLAAEQHGFAATLAAGESFERAITPRKKVTPDSFLRGMDLVIGEQYVEMVDIVIDKPQYVGLAIDQQKGVAEITRVPLKAAAAKAGALN